MDLHAYQHHQLTRDLSTSSYHHCLGSNYLMQIMLNSVFLFSLKISVYPIAGPRQFGLSITINLSCRLVFKAPESGTIALDNTPASPSKFSLHNKMKGNNENLKLWVIFVNGRVRLQLLSQQCTVQIEVPLFKCGSRLVCFCVVSRHFKFISRLVNPNYKTD